MYLCAIHLNFAGLVHEGKADIGCLPSLPLKTNGNPDWHPECVMCEDNKNLVLAASSTIRSWSPIPRKLDFLESKPTLANVMPSSPSLMLHAPMYGKKTPEFPERSSSLEVSPYAGIQQLTGMPSEMLLSREVWMKYHPTYSFVVTINSEELAKTIYDQLLWSVPVTCFGVELELVNRVAPGKKQVWMLILKTPTPNFGMAIKVKILLSSMNFGVQLVSPMYSGGWIGIRSLWKLKDRACAFAPVESG
uniref:Uncharacterized protein n=1 Tax=Cressdnaviricota sp. TaxID=2748378 RepID=A0A6M3YPM2_9VIRU|nr:MAG: hypothetical protein [Cressdnaviricota sp.]